MSRDRRSLALVLLLLVAACRASVELSWDAAPWFRAPSWNAGPEPYSAWFGDAHDGVLYFGLSPFWTLWW